MTVPRPRPTWSAYQPLRSWRKRIFFRQPSDILSIYRLTPDDVPGIVKVLNAKVDPYSIYGASSAIHFIAECSLAEGLSLDRTPRAAIGTNDTFGLPQRECASAFLGCPAYSRYGAYEVGGGVAQTCPDNPRVHHVLSELVILEVVGDDLRPVRPGERGRVLLTDLTNFVVPLIRYDIGDMATAAEGCSCGRPWPVVGEIIGRSADRIILEDGESRPAFELEAALFYLHAEVTNDILEYQFVQHGPGEIEMRVVPRKEIGGATVERLREVLVSALMDKASVVVVPVDHIDRSEGGKRRLVIQGGPSPGASK
jgi:phenylacetate-CoA ligase